MKYTGRDCGPAHVWSPVALYSAFTLLCLHSTLPSLYTAFALLCLHSTLPSLYSAFALLCLHSTLPSPRISIFTSYVWCAIHDARMVRLGYTLNHSYQPAACGFPYTMWYTRQGKSQSAPAPAMGSQDSCQHTVKLHILILVSLFPLGKG